MDKYEYNLTLEKVKELAEQESFEEAAALADTIDWRRVRNARTLCMISEIYEACGRLEESRNMLVRAYQKTKATRTILFRLTEISIKLKDFDTAAEYYSEFVNAAPHDNSKYLLKYLIYKGRGAAIEDQIDILEEYNEREFTEKYAYEIAKLYYRCGNTEKCIAACDDLVVWFRQGKYVIRALELKQKLTDLTPVQQAIYDNRNEAVPPKPDLVEAVAPELEKVILENMPESTKEVMTDDVIQETEKELAQVVTEHTAAQNEKEENLNWNFEPKGTAGAKAAPKKDYGFNTADLQAELAKSMHDIVSGLTRKSEESDIIEPVNDIAAEEEPIEALQGADGEENSASIDDILLSMSQETAASVSAEMSAKKQAETEGVFAAEISTPETTDVPTKAALLPEETETENAQTLKAKADALLKQADADAAAIMEHAAAEAAKIKENAEIKAAELRERANRLQEKTEAKTEAAYEYKEEETEPKTEADELPKTEIKEAMKTAPQAEAKAAPETAPEAEAKAAPETIPQAEAKASPEAAPEAKAEGVPMKTRNIAEAIESEPAPEPEEDQIPTELTEEQKELFSYFATIGGLREQIAGALYHVMKKMDSMDQTSKTGNLIVLGAEGSGKTSLGVRFAQCISQKKGEESAKVAKIYAEDLNKKDIAATVAKISGGTLIIEEAGDLEDAVVEQLSIAMEFRTDSLLVILEDDKKYLKELFEKHPVFAEKFSAEITIPVFTNDELVNFGRLYAYDADYKLDETARIALYERIGELQASGQPVTVIDVKEILDAAIKKSEKFGFRKFGMIVSNKRYDEDDRVILYEKDFQ